MKKQQEILNELYTQAPALIQLQEINVFKVPDGYFENFSNTMNDLLISENLPVISKNLISVPEGYFENFADTVLARIKAETNKNASEELRELSPAIYSIGNENVYTVPRNYFNDLPQIITNRLIPAKVVSMKPKSRFASYAMAAVVTGLMGLSLFSIFNNNKNTGNEAAPALIASVHADASQILKTNSFDKVMETIQEEDIVDFLEKSGGDVEAALVASAADSKELPTTLDYIIDDKTLDRFLDDLDINNYSN